MRPNLPFLSDASNAILKPGGLLKWKKRLVKDVRLLLQLTEVMKIVRLTSPLPYVLLLSVLRTRLKHNRRFALLSRRNLTLNLYTFSFDGSPSSFSFLNFPYCFSSRESTSVFADYLRSHFSLSQPEATFPSSAKPRVLKCLTRPFALPSTPLNFLELPLTSPRPLSLAQTIAYPMLKHLPRSGMDFFHICNLSWSLHSFPSIWKRASIIPIHKMGKPHDSPASFRPISLTSCVSKAF